MLIEPECAALAAQQATPAQLAAIRAAHEGMSLTDMPGQHDRAFTAPSPPPAATPPWPPAWRTCGT